MVRKISEKEFVDVKNASVALVDFSASWCGPCKMLAPVLEDVSEEMADKCAFFNVDVDENPGLAEEFGITNIPALVVLKAGEKVGMQVGFAPKDNIISFINSNL